MVKYRFCSNTLPGKIIKINEAKNERYPEYIPVQPDYITVGIFA